MGHLIGLPGENSEHNLRDVLGEMRVASHLAKSR
jgi:hypothetical protein